MCNFVLRPIKSYATIDYGSDVKRGDYVEVERVEGGNVHGKLNGKDEVSIQLYEFVRCFTADPKDVARVKEEEKKWFTPAS